MLITENLTFSTGNRTLLDKISLTFSPGSLYGILGPNGSGKSTFFKTLSSIWKPTQGQVLWQNNPLHRLSRREISRVLTLVPQSPRLHFDFGVLSFVKMGAYALNETPLDALIEQSLQATDCWHLRNRRITQLSGGELQRVYLARALATKCPVLLLDEPTAHLDIRHQLEIWDLLKKLASENRIIITSQHDLVLAQRYCDALAIFSEGRCMGFGSPNEILTPDLLESVFGIRLDPYCHPKLALKN